MKRHGYSVGTVDSTTEGPKKDPKRQIIDFWSLFGLEGECA